MSNDKRVLKNKEIIKSLYLFLLDVKNNPLKYENIKVEIIKALKSQGSLSKYENEDFGLEKTSINTLKRLSPDVIDGGFDELDTCRIKALTALKNNNLKNEAPNKNTKYGMELMIKELENKVKTLQESQLILTQGLTRSIHCLQQIETIKDTSKSSKLASINKKELLSIISCSQNKREKSKIINIKDFN